jgi:hypothetical protein
MENVDNNGWGYAVFNTQHIKGHQAMLGNACATLAEALTQFEMYSQLYKCELVDRRTTKVIRKN